MAIYEVDFRENPTFFVLSEKASFLPSTTTEKKSVEDA
jgi:hypothetical protein